MVATACAIVFFSATKRRASIREPRPASLKTCSSKVSEFCSSAMRCSPLGPLVPESQPFTVLSLAPVHLITVLMARFEPRSSVVSASAIAGA